MDKTKVGRVAINSLALQVRVARFWTSLRPDELCCELCECRMYCIPVSRISRVSRWRR